MKPKDCYPSSRRGLRKDVFYFVLYISLREMPHSILPTLSRRVVDKNGGSGTGDWIQMPVLPLSATLASY